MSMINELFELTGRVALVTGGSSGIGRAIASALAAAGAAVVHAALEQEEDALQEAVTQVEQAGGKAAYVTCDVSRFDELPGVVENAASFFGPPDILVNAAGVNLREPWDKVSEKTWNKTIAINLTAPFFLDGCLYLPCRKKDGGKLSISLLCSQRAHSPIARHTVHPKGV